MYRKEDESRDEYGVWCNGIKVTLYGMCELFDQKMVEVVATSSVRPSVSQMFWWVPVLTAALRYLLHLSAEIRPPGSLLQQKEKENEMVNRKGSMISTSKGFQSKWETL